MALGYVVSCWLLVQVADLVLENIGSPPWVIQTIMLVLALLVLHPRVQSRPPS